MKALLVKHETPLHCLCGKILFTLYGTGPFWGPSGAHAAATLAAACSARAQQLRRPQIPDAVGGETTIFRLNIGHRCGQPLKIGMTN